MGHINLLTTFGDKKGSKTIMIRYLLVIVFTSYNILFGWPTFNELGDIISTPHLTMKFLSTSGKIITVRADQATTRECYAASLKIAKGKKGGRAQSTIVACTSLTNNLGEAELDPREEELRVEPTEEDLNHNFVKITLQFLHIHLEESKLLVKAFNLLLEVFSIILD
ncbi:hypothetical protein JHK87_043772 [Glycine soja]|nr:hypothetical protein JHK87_043772 [Glycine soja]